jgi:hypothetical protein
MLKQVLLFAGFVFAAGCAAGDATPEFRAQALHRGTTRQAMVGGTVSTTAQDSVVFLMKGDEESCSGTLIAPNLVLTARHCVATPDEENECGKFTAVTAASNMTIKAGVSAGWETGTTIAKGKKIIEPDTNNGCGFDAALIILDRNVANAKISPVRFTPLQKGEKTIAVGYGVDENEKELTKRMQRATTILGIGPEKVAYKMEDGKTFNYDAPSGDVVTGESTCSGDSGGPLFDASGAVVAMTSRGPFDGPTGGVHGKTGCGDMVSIYASTIANKAMILKAAAEAGHPISDDGSAADDPDTQSTNPGNTSDDDGDSADDDDDKSDDDDDDDDSAKKKKKSTAAADTGGCSSAPGRPGQTGNGWLMLLGVGLALATSKKRASAARKK